MSDEMARMSRRQWLGTSASLMVASSLVPRTEVAAGEPGDAGLIVRELSPPNFEMPFSTLNSFVTPSDQMYVRCHFPVPQIKPESFSLKIEGRVKSPFTIGIAELKKLSSTTVTTVMECAGNGRVSLVPKVRGVAWDLGAVGNVTWTGVPLSLILERAGIEQTATEVLLEGADSGAINDDPKSPGEIRFDRSIPVAKATKDVILAYQMNGLDLTPAHGFPLRAIVPGWYGMASVKWLTRVVVLDQAYQGYFQSLDYAYFDRTLSAPSLTSLTTMQVKAQIAQPNRFERIKQSTKVRVHGAAWSGDSPIAKVEFSDDGSVWHATTLLGPDIPNAWRLWEYPWTSPDKTGPMRLAVRATDKAGNTQPLTRSIDRRTYMINHVVPIDIQIV